MTYRTILVDLTADGPVEARLDVARSLASRFDAALVGMHVMPAGRLAPIWEGGGSIWEGGDRPAARDHRSAAQNQPGGQGARPRRLRPRLRHRPQGDLARGRGRPRPAPRRGRARLRPGDHVEGRRARLAEQLVTATGVPVLVLPPEMPRDSGRVVLVAWKGSPEAARAVHEALPFLQHAAADRVVLCAVGEKAVAGAGLDDAVAMLERHGVPAQPERVGRTDWRSTGDVLLAQATAHGADLLVMGAYGHARMREFVFGGVTRYVLNTATLPVLFSG